MLRVLGIDDNHDCVPTGESSEEISSGNRDNRMRRVVRLRLRFSGNAYTAQNAESTGESRCSNAELSA